MRGSHICVDAEQPQKGLVPVGEGWLGRVVSGPWGAHAAPLRTAVGLASCVLSVIPNTTALTAALEMTARIF